MRFFLFVPVFSVLFLWLCGCGGVKNNNPILTAAAPSSAVADDSVYFADATGTIHALQTNGVEKWRYSLLTDLKKRPNQEVVDVRVDRLFSRAGNRLFGIATEATGAEAGRTFLFALEENKLLWLEATVAPEPISSPIAIGETGVYLAGNDGVLYAFNLSNGEVLWQYRVSTGIIGSPSVGTNETIYVTGPRQNLHAVSSAGKQLWVAETGSN